MLSEKIGGVPGGSPLAGRVTKGPPSTKEASENIRELSEEETPSPPDTVSGAKKQVVAIASGKDRISGKKNEAKLKLFDMIKKERDKIEPKVNDINTKIKALRSEIKNAVLEKEVEQIENEIGKLKKELDKVQKKLSDLEEDYESL